ncbi:hypothetical protein Vretifemale_19799 [Volvox reticuliferus]|uniref:Uncharacterized protein n=1 Tax=Volvox reticuliferus TaxID=1737510 RepID=A0A8J4FZF0_9CHLO|nr:hypothetical protein Vretifemale_19799 [Volvox reticuliferus]
MMKMPTVGVAGWAVRSANAVMQKHHPTGPSMDSRTPSPHFKTIPFVRRANAQRSTSPPYVLVRILTTVWTAALLAMTPPTITPSHGGAIRTAHHHNTRASIDFAPLRISIEGKPDGGGSGTTLQVASKART